MSRRRLLVIEDDPELRRVVSLYLGRLDFDVEVAEDGESGLMLADTGAPDVVILDLLMPRVDGLEVVRRLRERPTTAEVPVILYTAVPKSDPRVAAALRLGRVRHEFKGKMSRLAAVVRAALDEPGPGEAALGRSLKSSAIREILGIARLRLRRGTAG